jgi:hypothetical protein
MKGQLENGRGSMTCIEPRLLWNGRSYSLTVLTRLVL